MRRFVIITIAIIATLPAVATAGPFPSLTGSISGVVTDENGAPLDRICVRATSALPVVGVPSPLSVTDADGRYTISQLSTGLYRVSFTECAPAHIRFPYATEWYDDVTREQEATLLLIAPGASISDVDASLVPKGAIVGTVTDTAGDPIPWMCVTRVEQRYAWGNFRAGADGRFRIPVEDDDPVELRFGCENRTDAARSVYVMEWFDDARERADATLLSTTRGHEVTADAVMERSGSITGRLIDRGSDPVGYLCVAAHRPDGSVAAEVEADGDGVFVIPGLTTDSYTVRARACHNDPWIDASHTDQDGVPIAVPVTWGHDTDDVVIVLDPTGSAGGRVTDQNGDPVLVHVAAYRADQPFASVSIATDANGHWTLPFLQPAVHIEFTTPDGVPLEWYDDAPDRSGATIVHVPSATHVGGIDAVVTLPA